MTMDYEDMVRTVTRKYLHTLLKHDQQARDEAAAEIQTFGLNPEAADTIIQKYSIEPLQEWAGMEQSAPRSGA